MMKANCWVLEYALIVIIFPEKHSNHLKIHQPMLSSANSLKTYNKFLIFKYSSNFVEQKEGVILSFHNCPILKTFKKNNCKVRKVWIFFFLCFFRAGAILILLFFSRNLLTGWQALWGVLKKNLTPEAWTKMPPKLHHSPLFLSNVLLPLWPPVTRGLFQKG